MKANIGHIIKHPSYNTDTADYDVALLELTEPLIFTKYVQPVCLPANSHVFPPGKKCLISGWGYLKEDFCKQNGKQVRLGVRSLDVNISKIQSLSLAGLL